MPTAPAQLNFVSNLFTSKIFLTQVIALAASIASAAGVHVLDDQGTQQQIIGVLDFVITAILRWQFSTGPVSVSGPVSTPSPRDVPSGVSVVTVVSPKEQEHTAAQAVQPIGTGVHEVTVAAPSVPGTSAPATVAVARVQ